MKNKLRSFMVLAALAVCFGTFSVTAYAQSNEPQTEPAPVEETTEPEETAEPNPFTPNGTGTVLDNATSEDEKEFYTIVTEDENVFYLVIDKQRDTENVYFLNAVTESDLMASHAYQHPAYADSLRNSSYYACVSICAEILYQRNYDGSGERLSVFSKAQKSQRAARPWDKGISDRR